MRLLMLNNEYPPIGGGTATANYYVIREMAQRGVQVDLITSTRSSSVYEVDHLSASSTVYRVPIDNRNIRYYSERELITYTQRALRFIQSLKRNGDLGYDLVHAWSGIPAGALALLVKWQHRIPYIVGLRGSDVPGHDRRYNWLYPILKPGLHAIWGSASALTANSYELRRLALAFRPQETIDVIPNGVDLTRFNVTQLRDKGRDETLRILFVSRMVDGKGIDDVLNSIPLIRQKRENFKFIFVGGGDKEAQFKAYAARSGLEQWVEFKGKVQHQKIPAVYNDADIFILPSLYEGMSNAVLEAMAAGLPVITTYIGGTAEMLRGNGILVPKNAPDAIAQAVLELCDSYELRVSLGKRSRAIAESLMWEHVAERYLQLYERTLSKLKVKSEVRLPAMQSTETSHD